MSINVTKTFLPPLEEYYSYLSEIWTSGMVTNHAKFNQKLETELKNYLGVEHLVLVNNGTSALQIAIKALDLRGEIITTAFSYVATASSIVWENCTPIFVDIDPQTFCIDSGLIEEKISTKTTAILATHVFGNPCDLDQLKILSVKYDLKLVFDGAHAFGARIKGNALLDNGDISTTSFHATKLFHTIEGGAIICKNGNIAEKCRYMRNFGHRGQESFWGLGINAKLSELHASLGLINLKYLSKIIKNRKEASSTYKQLLDSSKVKYQKLTEPLEYNFAYFPIVLESEEHVNLVLHNLKQELIFPRRYFYPALTQLPYVKNQYCRVAESVSRRILCLPLSHDLGYDIIEKTCQIINKI